MAESHTKTSGAARMAVIYITTGAIMDVWTVIWYIYMKRHGTATDGPYFWCYGFFLTGLTLIIIGLALGRIGRSARHAETPPSPAPNPSPQGHPPAANPGVVPMTPVAAVPPPSNPAIVPGGAAAPVAQPVAGVPGNYPPH
jgi:hypothetical protein